MNYTNDYYDPELPSLRDAQAALRRPAVPTTLYEVAGDNGSGVAGLWMPTGEVIPKAPSKVGLTIEYTDHDFRIKTAVVRWDGGMEEDRSSKPIGYIDPKTRRGPVYQGRSRGLLLGDYQIRERGEVAPMQGGRPMGRRVSILERDSEPDNF